MPASSRQREFLGALFNGVAEETHLCLEERQWEEIGYGGARGGGKTFTSALAACMLSMKFPGIKTLLIRKGLASVKHNFRDELTKVHGALDIGRGVRYYKSESLYQYLNGSMIHFGYCDSDSDFEQYQGLAFSAMGFEEIAQMTEYSYASMIGSNRSNVIGGRAFRWGTCNPGGEGHAWVYDRFVDPKTRKTGTRWVQALVTDNPAMLVYDPGYIDTTLAGLPFWRRRQWLHGDWDAMSGQFWAIPDECVRDVEIPRYANYYAGVDWGRARPFAVVYVAFWTEYLQNPLTHVWDAVDRVHVFHTIYRKDLEIDEQAEAVAEAEAELGLGGRSVVYFADPATGKRLEGKSTEAGDTIRRVWAQCGFATHPARTNARVPGWQLMKRLMNKGSLTISPSCGPLLSEMRRQVYVGSPGPPTGEDFRQGQDVLDDASDACRYVIVSITGLVAPEKPIGWYERMGVAA